MEPIRLDGRRHEVPDKEREGGGINIKTARKITNRKTLIGRKASSKRNGIKKKPTKTKITHPPLGNEG